MEADYIGWGIAILGILISMLLKAKNRKLVNANHNINNSAKTIQQFIQNNNINVPPEINDEIEVIINNSSTTTRIVSVRRKIRS